MEWTATKFSVVPLPCGWLHLCAGEKTGRNISTPPWRPPFGAPLGSFFLRAESSPVPPKPKLAHSSTSPCLPSICSPFSSSHLPSLHFLKSHRKGTFQFDPRFWETWSIACHFVSHIHCVSCLCQITRLGELPFLPGLPSQDLCLAYPARPSQLSQPEHSPVCCALFPL